VRGLGPPGLSHQKAGDPETIVDEERCVNEHGVDLWRGGVQASECDQMGHMNVAYYLAKASEALGGLAAALGMPRAFSPGAKTTLILRDQHVRYLREARHHAALSMTGGVIELGESDGRVLMLLHHASGALAATYQLVVAHVDAATGEERPWPAEARARAEALKVEVPQAAAARSCHLNPVDPQTVSLSRALTLGLPQTTLCVVQPNECDAFGRMRPEPMLTRIIDGAVHLASRDPNEKKTLDVKAGLGGAAVEYRLIYFEPVSMGQRLEVRAGFSKVDAKVRHLLYWVLDADTGRALGLADSVVVSFDLNTRKMLTLDDEALASAQATVVPGLDY
jgi:acyl-CoA thioester hydrolase